MLAVCGAALCENVEGSFLCLCASDLEEYDAQEGRCRPRVAGGERAPHYPTITHSHSMACSSTAPAPEVQPGLGLVWCVQGCSLGVECGEARSRRVQQDKRGFCPRPRNIQEAAGL